MAMNSVWSQCHMFLNNGASLLRQPADHPRGLAVAVLHPPQLALHRRLQHTLGREVERRRWATHGLRPVHQLLPVSVLVPRRLAVAVVAHVAPYLGDDEGRVSAVDVRLGDGRRVTLGEVEAPAVEAKVILEPVEPVGKLALHTRVEVVDVGRGGEVGAGVAVTAAVGVLRVVAADHVGAPVEAAVRRAALEDAVDAAAILVVRAPVVDDDVGDAHDAPAVEGGDERPELRLRAVLGRVQVVEPARHVPLRRDGVRRRREPDVRDPGRGDVVDAAMEEVVPPALLLPRLPVEPLHQKHCKSHVNIHEAHLEEDLGVCQLGA
uniref:Uncharacterized protein n=1 Tax=Oryza brachyantha TaxID=4533 RepID=J3MY47_ORYBR